VLAGASPRGVLTARAVDGTAQESAVALTYSGAAEAVIAGPPVDLSRQRNGDMALAFLIRLDAAPTGPIELGFGRQRVDIAPLLEGLRPGVWRPIQVRLSCFDGAETGMTAVETPFSLRSGAPLRVSLADIGLVSSTVEARCPRTPG
jgi:beta-glucosidase